MDNKFVKELVDRKFSKVIKHQLMQKISNWNKIQEYFDSNPDVKEISDCLAIELQGKKRPQICKRLHQRLENVQRSNRAEAIGCYVRENG